MRKALFAALAFICTATISEGAYANEEVVPLLTNARVVSVSASEDVFAKPDKAVFLIMIESDGVTFKKSLEINTARLKKLQELASALGFTQTHEYINLSQESSSFIKMNRAKSYRLLRFVNFETQTMKSVPELALKIAEWDDYYLREIHFENSEIESQKNKAFSKAFEKAKTRAEFVAKEASQKLGRFVRISDTYTETSPKATPVNCDSIKVTAKVDLSCELLDIASN